MSAPLGPRGPRQPGPVPPQPHPSLLASAAAPPPLPPAPAPAPAAAADMSQMPDLSHLTEEERKIILAVMDRQRQEEEKEQSMLRGGCCSTGLDPCPPGTTLLPTAGINDRGSFEKIQFKDKGKLQRWKGNNYSLTYHIVEKIVKTQ